MKTGKKILLTALSTTLLASMATGLALTAFADEATKDHEYDAKNDVVFEDFDRDNIENTVKAEGAGVNVGEKPYLHVKYTAGKSITPGDPIYKQGSGSLANVQTGGKITLKMRAPEGDVDLSEIKFGIRGVDNDNAVLAKTLDELKDSEGDPLPELTTEWQTYEIAFATNYEDEDVYPTSEDTVTETPLLAIHIYAATETDTGTLDIASVEYSTTGSNLMNDFLGGETVQDTAKNADSGTWWAGSTEGHIVKRAVNMTGGSFTVVKDTAVGDYSYAVIEAEGDVENLKVATTTDGTTWGTAAAYDGYSVKLTGEEKGFKFIYDGEDENGVTIKRIYLTNLSTVTPATAVPVIDASTAEVLEDFSVAQSGFTGVWEDMSTAPQLALAGLEYRLSYNNGDKVEVKDGCLVFDATNLAESEFINYKFKSKTAAHGDYIVFKVKAEDGANLDAFRFALGNPEDQTGDVIWTNQMKAGVQYPVALLGDDNPYKDGDWSYIVVNLEESGFKLYEDGYSIMDIYYSGAGKLYIDNVFFANKLANVEQDFKADGVTFAGTEEGYAYAGGFGLNNKYGTATSFSFDITPADDGFDPSALRLELNGAGTYWAAENSEGTLITTDGKTLSQLTYTKGQPTHIEIDLEASKIGAFDWVHVHVGAIGGFTLNNVALHTSTAQEDFVELSDNVVSVDGDFAGKTDAAGYAYIGGADVAYGKYGKIEFTVIPGADFDAEALRVELKNGGTTVKEIWVAQYGETVITADGKKYADITFEEGTPVTFVFDLISINASAAINQLHVHSAGSDTGAFTLNGVKLTALQNNYAEQLSKIPAYLDTTDPTVSITTKTTAKAGDEITIAYTASDDTVAAADLNVIVSVTKDGKAVTLTGNKFTAEKGVYTVSVTVRDLAGNEASDTIQITVSAANNGGLSTGAVVGIVVGCIAVVMIAGATVYLVMKKKKND